MLSWKVTGGCKKPPEATDIGCRALVAASLASSIPASFVYAGERDRQ